METQEQKSNLAQLRDVRLEKIQSLRKMGIDPYPAIAKKDVDIKKVLESFSEFENKTIKLAGRLMSLREHGQLVFGHIADQSAKIQLYIRNDTINSYNKERQNLGFSELNLLDVGDFVNVEGTITKTKTGEISVLVKDLWLISKALRPLPDKWKSITDKETRYRRRYLDLTMNQETKELFVRKAKFFEAARDFLTSRGFMEVETPVLEYKTGGADARPFITHHNDLGIDLYMRISTELYQKRLIGGGYEKIFTLGPNFRNEGVDDEHLQEYQQIEWYWAYADYKDNMQLTKDLFIYLAQQVYGRTVFETRGHKFDLAKDWKEFCPYGTLLF
ncbi:MAG TPA: OB-fold nucleic acid binding domain-containing protein [Candidatus Dojkabacteria bacterium]|nr:OB-fold nucleic acid binding domain-containing protein [Candidatus Dojkabacteria bacterium]